ncbi:AraC family transcriptional regulator [Clostridium neuense]|uniref:AraC family transcriptional regulator n=1 Tax=Clostridium neuense TaxID=1728934 RepID=A0ABW8TLM9_9CLOT
MNPYLQTKLYSSELAVKLYCLENCSNMPHWHIDVEIILVTEGSIKVGINDDSRILNKGDMAIFGSTDIHYLDSTNMSSKINMIIFRPDIVSNSFGWPETFKLNTPFINEHVINKIKLENYKKIADIFHSIVNEMKEKETAYDLCIKGKLIELCAFALRYLPISSIDKTKKGNRLPDINRIKNAMKFIEDNYANNITLNDISQRVHFSACYFSRMFKKFTGTNFATYLSEVRVENAEFLIKTTSKTIAEIAFECGFNSVRTFNRVFKKIKGYTPSSLD